jgi:hypothetical protein
MCGCSPASDLIFQVDLGIQIRTHCCPKKTHHAAIQQQDTLVVARPDRIARTPTFSTRWGCKPKPPTDQVEQQLPAGLRERQIAQFVEHDKILAA